MKDKCSDYGKLCNGCKRNAGRRSYYDPDYHPYYPTYPDWTPWYPYYPYITYRWHIGDPIYTTPTTGKDIWITYGNSLTDERNSYFIS